MDKELDYKKLLVKYIESSDIEKGLDIRKFLEREKISFNNGRFSVIEEKPVKKSTSSVFKPGDSLFYKDGHKSLIVQDVKYVNRRKMLYAVDSKTGESMKLLQSDPLLKRWSIDDAYCGDIVATDNFVFIFDGFGMNLRTFGYKVSYACAVYLHPERRKDPFVVPEQDEYIGNKSSKMFRIPTEKERRLLVAEMTRHGYDYDNEKNVLVREPNFLYLPGEWIIHKDDSELYKVDNFIDNKYRLADMNGVVRDFVSGYVNSFFRKWSALDLKNGDIVYYTEKNGDQMVSIFDSMVGVCMKCSATYNITKKKYDKDVLLDRNAVIEPAMYKQKNIALKAFSDETFLMNAYGK